MSPRHPGVNNIDTARLQGLDPRTKMLLHRPPVPGNIPQQFQNNQMIQQRMAVPRSQMPEQYDSMQQRFPGIYIFFNSSSSFFPIQSR